MAGSHGVKGSSPFRSTKCMKCGRFDTAFFAVTPYRLVDRPFGRIDIVPTRLCEKCYEYYRAEKVLADE